MNKKSMATRLCTNPLDATTRATKTMNNKQKLERANLVESIATKDAWLHPYELAALKKHAAAMARDEKIRLAKLGDREK